MKAILGNMVWVAILCATGFLIGTQVGHAGPVRCSTSTIHATIEVDGVTVVLHGITICSNGGVTLAGHGLRCTQTGIKTVKVQGRTARVSGVMCR